VRIAIVPAQTIAQSAGTRLDPEYYLGPGNEAEKIATAKRRIKQSRKDLASLKRRIAEAKQRRKRLGIVVLRKVDSPLRQVERLEC